MQNDNVHPLASFFDYFSAEYSPLAALFLPPVFSRGLSIMARLVIPATTFPQFLQLPCELRHMIWGHALEDARKAGLHSEDVAIRSLRRQADFFTIFDTRQEGDPAHAKSELTSKVHSFATPWRHLELTLPPPAGGLKQIPTPSPPYGLLVPNLAPTPCIT